MASPTPPIPTGPRLLWLDTAAEATVVAAAWGPTMVAWHQVMRPRWNGRLLGPLVNQALHHLGWTLADLDAVAVAWGPGSYTGLRIGLAHAKGLAMGLDRPLLAPNGLLAAALCHHGAALAAGLDLRVVWPGRGPEGYTARYRPLATYPYLQQVEAPRVSTLASLPPADAQPTLPAALWVGPPNSWPGKPYPVALPLAGGEAHGLARYLTEALAQGHVAEPEQLEPLYLRPVAATAPKPKLPPAG